MESLRWLHVQEVYLEALERPAAGRKEWLRERCGHDTELFREVETLLEAGTGDSILDASLDDLLGLLGDEKDLDPSAPATAGPYVILEEIGRGGMGRVYRARRDDGEYSREVALKVVAFQGRGKELVRRFRRERQILAALEHPNIARLYGTGVTDEGRPYLAMELVAGERIHRYCDRLRLGVRERLALFEQVVEGVEYAHRQLVIHRDLKPSNILVTGAGEVKLLDFGIAKLLGPHPGAGLDDDPLTRPDQRLFTPEYASPEQLRGEPLSTASDVYSLGVLLHRLLVGRRPEEEPVSLVEALEESRDEEEIRELADARTTSVARLRRVLQGELNTIVGKAIAPEVDRRYPSADALLEDLRRYRSGRPIRARPPSTAYRLRKFVGRNRTAVAAGAAALVALTVGLGVALHQARVAHQERDAARAVSSFLEEVFTASTPFQESGERLDTLPIREFLESAVTRLDSTLVDQPRLKARMEAVLGTVHLNLGMLAEARGLLNASLAGYRRVGEASSPEVAEVLLDLGRLTQVSGDPVAAERQYRDALDAAVAVHGSRSPEAAEVQAELAGVLLEQDRLDEAADLLSGASEIHLERSGEHSLEMADRLNRLGVLQYRRGRIEEAVATMRSSLEMYRELVGADHPNTIILSQNLGFVLARSGAPAEAEPLLRDALRGMRANLGPEYPFIGPTISALAGVLDDLDRWASADSLYRESVAFIRRVQGEDSQDLNIALFDYGSAVMRRGDLARADTLLRESLEVARRVMGPEAVGTGVTMGGVAELRRRQGAWVESERLYRAAAGILATAFPPTHPRLLDVRRGIALTRAGRGYIGEAEDSLLAIHGDATTLEDGGVAVAETAAALATFYELVGDDEETRRWRGVARGEASVSEPGG